MSTRVPEADLGAENPNAYETRDYYTKPQQKTWRTQPERKSMAWRITYVSRNEVELNLDLAELQNPSRALKEKKSVRELFLQVWQER